MTEAIGETTAASGRIGRPGRSEALRRQEELLDRALELFIENGYEQTTMDQIARSLKMTKRTIYARYADKAEFFKAAVMRAIERVVSAQVSALLKLEELPSLADTLEAVARLRISQVMSPEGRRLQRIVNAETYRFPEIYAQAQRYISKPVVDFLADVLRRYAASGEIRVKRPDMTAAAFMSMVAGVPVRQIGLGNAMSEAEIDDRIAFSIGLLMDGIRG